MSQLIPEKADRMMRFLFLQGIPSLFFDCLGRKLAQHGHHVGRINFNGGDRAMWSGPATDYRGTRADWPGFLNAWLLRDGTTDIVLFGDCRPMHRAAILIARDAGVRVHVFEEGYIRPDCVTLERDGVNGNSRLSRDPSYYRAYRAAGSADQQRPFRPPTFFQRARDAILYNAAEVALRPFYPHYRTHRALGPLREGAGWAGRLLRRRREKSRSASELVRLGTPARLFVMPLQLDTDSQIIEHSPFDGMGPAIDLVIRSFAANTGAADSLLLKGHPLDNGIRDWRSHAARAAEASGVGGRVFFVETGDLEAFLARADGVVTVNSTSGTLALARGVPVRTLGRAVYDIRGITDQKPLHDFWRHPEPPDAVTWNSFRRALWATRLVRGGFYGTEAIGVCVEGCVARLEAASLEAGINEGSLAA